MLRKQPFNHPELGEEEKKLLRVFELDKDRCGLYEKASRINHSCSPNAFWQVEASSTKLTVRTCQGVEVGEEIVVDYYMFDVFLLHKERISKILEDRLFICR